MVRRLEVAVNVGLLAVVVLVADPTVRAADLEGRIAYLAAQPDKSLSFAGSLRFHTAPSAAQLGELQALGVVFTQYHGRTVYPASIPFACLEALRQRADLASVECAWRPAARPPLAHSVPQIGADRVWRLDSPAGGTVTGKGVLVCDLDTGVNYLHAGFLQLTDERYVWLDVDGSGGLSDGDAVDLDRDGVADAGEALRHRESVGTSTFGNVMGPYDPQFDFLFNDADVDESHDYGPPEFDDGDPCFGERLFLCDDANANDRLDPGEELLALGGTRIRAILNRDGTVHRRGSDLLASERDDWGHGTFVSGIVSSGWPRGRRMVGVAPGAELMHVNLSYREEPPFLSPVEAGLGWAIAEGADVVLIEDGEWIWEYLDGSSHLETLMNEYAADQGVIFVVPAGNLAIGRMHSRFASSGGQGLVVAEATTVVWASVLWTEPVSLGLTLTPPGLSAIELSLDGTAVEHVWYRIYSNVSVSPRGTRRIDLRIASRQAGYPVEGTWQLAFPGPDVPVHGYFFDDQSSWVSASYWLVGEDPGSTVTWPATADSAIVVAEYWAHGNGEIAAYSSRGPRIDGVPVLDLAAPGSVSSTRPDLPAGYGVFLGTSCAAAHVAGAAALLKELDPSLDHGRCCRFLRAGAIQDPYTSDPQAAGAGKLRVDRAVAWLLADLSQLPSDAAIPVTVYPNPFRAGATVRFQQPADGAAVARIFDLAGREIWSIRLGAAAAGLREVAWDGRDEGGRPVGAGVYVVHLSQGGRVGATKLTLLH